MPSKAYKPTLQQVELINAGQNRRVEKILSKKLGELSDIVDGVYPWESTIKERNGHGE